MHLEAKDRVEIEAMVTSYYYATMNKVMNRSHAIFALAAVLSLLVSIAGMIIVTWVLPGNKPGWIHWTPFFLSVIVLQISNTRHKKHWRKMPNSREIKRRFQEIADCDADEKDRQLFLELMTAAQGKDLANLRGAIQQIMGSPVLSKLTFVRDLNSELKHM